jgi:hypothetical protein
VRVNTALAPLALRAVRWALAVRRALDGGGGSSSALDAKALDGSR